MTAEAVPDPPRRLLIGVCGSANVLAVPQYLMALRTGLGPGVEIRMAMTRSAAVLVPAATMRLLCRDVTCDGEDELTTGHVAPAVWADRFVVLPATANMLGQAAHGLASGLLSSALLAHERPVLFFPSMNSLMWERPAVRRNVARLRADGHAVVDPVLAPAWQIAAGEVRKDLGLPPPTTVTAVIREFLDLDVGPLGG
ncbi:flavoprotein [uncultured Streptomyces sp.]|uniref:flavoprotein n=1 Tax=uncultured Streptomyces sp. TaxID=174707 RepID=UPI00262A535B|nr:flavoprotein [uncultured Streptomyces sp.]